MDIRQLKYFVAVAEKLNFTEAAKSLYVAQSAVSQQISELEKHLGVKLFNRNRRTVELTTAGDVLYQEAIDLLKRFDEAQELTMNAHLGYRGHLKIGYIGYGDQKWIIKALRKFRDKFPNISVDVNRYNQGELTRSLKEGSLDMVITFSFGIKEQEGSIQAKGKIKTHHIYTDTVCLVAASDNPIATRWEDEPVPLEELESEAFIVQNRHESPQGFDKTLQICNSCGFSPKIEGTPNLVQTVLALVQADFGIALLPKSIQEYAGLNLSFLPLKIEENLKNYDIVAAWKVNNTNPSLKYLVETIEAL